MVLQALRELLPPLLIRRTREEVAAENFIFPPLQYSLVQVPLRCCDGYVLELLKSAALHVSV
jgi:hypothetical protein